MRGSIGEARVGELDMVEKEIVCACGEGGCENGGGRGEEVDVVKESGRGGRVELVGWVGWVGSSTAEVNTLALRPRVVRQHKEHL